MDAEWIEISPGIFVADDAPAWAYHAHSPQLNGVTAEDYRRSVEIDAAGKIKPPKMNGKPKDGPSLFDMETDDA